MKWTVPFYDLCLGEEEKEAVNAVIDSNWLTMGPVIEEFEAAFAETMGIPVPCSVALTNGTAALHLALLVLDIGPGDEVICPSLTFVADANVIRHVGATPVFADIRSNDDWTICPDDVQSKITERTKAVIAVHYAGYPCQMDRLIELRAQHGVRIVEDACHAPLSEWNGQKLGTIGDIGCFSFFSNKNMTSGEGGMLLAADPLHGERARLLRSHGMTSSSYERFKGHAFGYDVTENGYNYRLDEIRAVIALQQLKKLEDATHRRTDVVANYRKSLARKLPDVFVPFAKAEGRLAYHIFPVLLPKDGPDREIVTSRLTEAGIQTSIHYRPIHTFSGYQDDDVSLPRTEAIMSRILTLPMFPTMSRDQIDLVVDSLASALRA